MFKLKKKRKLNTKISKTTTANKINLENVRLKTLTLQQHYLRLRGIDIEIVGVTSSSFDERNYYGAVHYYNNENKYIWERVSPPMSYNNTLYECIKKAKELIANGEAIVRKREAF